MYTQLGNPTWLGFKLIHVWVSSLKLKGQISGSLTIRWAIIPTGGLNGHLWIGGKLLTYSNPITGLSGPLWIGGKLLTYSKPITGNGMDCELVG